MAATVLERYETHGDVERLQTSRAVAGRAIYWTSVYRIGGTLVDSGSSLGRAAFLRFTRGAPVADVLTTHEHEDHVGNHAVLPPGARVHVTPLTARLLREGPPAMPAYRAFTWGLHGAAPQGLVPLGTRVDTDAGRFLVIQTPGHSADHVAFLDEARSAAFTGDAYLGRFRAAREEEDVQTEAASLRRLADLDPAVMYPTHGRPVERPRARLLETAQYFEALRDRVQALAAKGVPPARIQREVLGGEPLLTYTSLGEFSVRNMVRNLLRRA